MIQTYRDGTLAHPPNELFIASFFVNFLELRWGEVRGRRPLGGRAKRRLPRGIGYFVPRQRARAMKRRSGDVPTMHNR
jgi:hypothetical protein